MSSRFAAVRARIRRWHVAWGCVLSAGFLAAGVLLMDGLDRFLPLREHVVFWCTAVAGLLSFAVFVRHWLRALLRGPADRELALAVEQARPEFMDALVCAVELAPKDAGKRNELEEALLAQVNGRLEGSDVIDTVFRPRLAWRRMLGVALLMAACLALAFQSRAWRKARARWSDFIRGTETGLTVSGPDAPVPIHTDARIGARIHRWENAASIEYTDHEGRHVYRMNRDGEARFFFSFYDVTEPIRYRVLTPSLASEWRSVEVYTPPSFQSVRIEVTPPDYTALEPTVLEDFANISAVVGSTVRIDVDTQEATSAVLNRREADQAFRRVAPGHLTASLPVERDEGLTVTLRSADGWELRGPVFELQARPDLPPVVEVVSPRGDTQAGAAESVPIEARAGDDFGLERVVLTYAVSGGPGQSVELFAAGEQRTTDRAIYHDIDLPALEVEAGDVVRYSLTATDNRRPDPQRARSDVYFIIVRPELDEEEKEGNKGEQKKLDISGLIAESKRLIRLTFDALSLPLSERAKPVEQLGRDLRDLRLEVRKTFNEAMSMAGGSVSGPIPELFGAADRELGAALAMLDQDQPAESLPPQEKALGHLVRLENELLKNAAKSQSKEGSEGEQQPQEQEKQDQQQTPRNTVKALKRAVQKARELAERQARLNRDVSRSRQASPEALKGLGEKQRSIENETHDLAEELARVEPARRAARSLQGAEREMERGGDRLDQADADTAATHGKRASNLLGAAIQDLQDAVRRAAANRINALARTAQRLSDAQREAAADSTELARQDAPDREAVSQGEERQRQLNQMAKGLRQAVDQTAAELEEQYPDATQALSEATRSLDHQGLERNMTRAANALLYGKPGRAKKPQTDAANALQQFAGQLESAVQTLPAMSREELVEAMRQMQQQARETNEAMKGEEGQAMRKLESIQQQASKRLDRLAAALSDEALQQIADQMALPLGEGGPTDRGRDMLRLFKAAVGVLERHLMATEVARRLDLNRRQSEPPREYRRLVEQYFRELSREP